MTCVQTAGCCKLVCSCLAHSNIRQLSMIWEPASYGSTLLACGKRGWDCRLLVVGPEVMPLLVQSRWHICVLRSRAGAVTTLAFANFSTALHAGAGGAGSGFAYAPRTADYSRAALSVDGGARQALGGRLAAVGAALETAFGGAQDVEGALVGERVYVVQTRPQP